MIGHWGKTMIGAAIICAALFGSERAAEAGALPSASYAETGSRTSVPYGWVDFCNRYAPECDGPTLPALDVDLTAKTFAEVDRVNRRVNATIVPVTDMDHWNVVDRWDYPLDGKGDCEDFALLKRKILISAGYPRQALLITVVKDKQGDGHAILTLKTSRGEFVLDNLSDRVKPWNDTGYKFVKRQSQENPNTWISIIPSSSDPLVTAGR